MVQELPFGTFDMNMNVFHDGQNMPLIEKYYVTSIAEDYYYYSDIDSVDSFLGAVDRLTLRLAIQGKVTLLDVNSFQFHITNFGVYIRDVFDFSGRQPLGFWSLSQKRVEIGPFVGGKLVDNGTYRNYRSVKHRSEDYITIPMFI